MRGDFMADLLIVRMDSWSSWLAGIATCTGDYFYTFLLIPTFSWTTTHDHQRQTVYRLLYTLCDVGTWFHSNPVRLSFSETSWECKGFMQFHLRPLFSGYPYRTNFDPCQGVIFNGLSVISGTFSETFVTHCDTWTLTIMVFPTLMTITINDHIFAFEPHGWDLNQVARNVRAREAEFKLHATTTSLCVTMNVLLLNVL